MHTSIRRMFRLSMSFGLRSVDFSLMTFSPEACSQAVVLKQGQEEWVESAWQVHTQALQRG